MAIETGTVAQLKVESDRDIKKLVNSVAEVDWDSEGLKRSGLGTVQMAIAM